MQWLQDWGPVLAPTLALFGVLVTVTAASRTYRRGQAEARKDRQRTLIADLIIAVRRYADLHQVFIMAAGKFQKQDLYEWPDTDSGRRQTELNQAVQAGLVRSLVEIRNAKLRPLIIELATRQRALTQGDDAAALFDHKLTDDVRFEAVLVVLRRIYELENLCNELELAAIDVLPVEIELPAATDKLKWLRPARPKES